jgi:hypothetical protein
MPGLEMLRLKRGPGRPRKFGRPSRTVTVTLPEDVLGRLEAIDVDLGRAIVTTVEQKRPRRAAGVQPAELASYGTHSVIVVPPFKALKQILGVELVPIGANRALISLEPHHIPELELEVRDALERDAVRHPERLTFQAVADILRRARLSHDFSIEERTIIVLRSKRRRRRRSK